MGNGARQMEKNMAKKSDISVDELTALINQADDLSARLDDIATRAAKAFGVTPHFIQTAAAVNRLAENATGLNRVLLARLEMQADADDLRTRFQSEVSAQA